MTFTSTDYQMMSRAISLAKGGIYTTTPNPNVGCVIAKDGEIVGEGFHYRAGEPHAEVHALRAAGENAQGATAYVTLEPCSHYGRTPPCAEALIKAKVAKVICAMQDPNPQVAGRGVNMMRDAGIEVEVGLLEQEANQLNPAFLKKMRTGMPYVQLKLAASLDGKTALSNGESKWITSSQARKDVQCLRAQAGAVLSTSKTVIEDNASLTVRWNELPDSVKAKYPEDELRQPVRVILDRQHQLNRELALYQSGGDVLTVSSSEKSDITVATSVAGQLDLKQVLSKLANEHNINHIWVEAGATLAGSLIEQKLVDELILYQAPKIMGADSRSLINLLGLEKMDQVVELDIVDVRMVGSDIRIVAKL
ncbi:bifunctional diaminohydroxyphosphoribosylaminopyrimidine deaminase/5-amino-6-(5-phosphoribosylamino)uracil reductase RibD [Vibrio sp. JC009]|uniref:bifunctional diaminohydroxyphosphoribosylaminopyrimidine deaminase/5-amino-6-(5-phosphoribosylamino)uracil reductase RibD n=1 Tax=Vibrio sp. JC009 TaxID=2912314 RepID=UPI0023B12056|nr:bifunctional diaminohydroxyphosphoribosylaminopyrimidine deaminase/5-amino-6-(5-phosphoribosylamino)uracil reductase RibD [Vibrio sp. JC009]WED21289.1 bifunctional diaminohydroxyphosphoribosylaminopyrimidine deaminase/5-amino-6-(5-phosphoribosylamino)uracil reductase RibD [Vibrio sp. JC009]